MAIIDKPSDYFNTVLYTGDASSDRTITNTFGTDFLWLKERNGGDDHHLWDKVRGDGKRIHSNLTNAESDLGTYIALVSTGFKVSGGTYNNNGSQYAAWNWKAGTSFTNDASATGIGSFDSSGSVNTDAGFSIISYTGNGSAGATVAHGLGAVPKVVFGKARNTSGEDWFFGHSSIGFNKYLKLNSTGAANTTSIVFNDTAPSSSVVTLGSNGIVNSGSYNHIMYCFAEKQGYSKFGSYTGNGSTDGTFVYTGFKPAWVMTKRTDSTSAWQMFDNTRSPSNPTDKRLKADDNSAEDTNLARDFLSNGFKIRTDNGTINGSGVSMIYMAFAENPFTTSTGVPATAR